MSALIKKNERRLRTIFERALLVAAAVPVAAAIPAACSLGSALDKNTGSGGGSASLDAGMNGSAATGTAVDACAPQPYQVVDDPCGSYMHLACGLPSDVLADGGGASCYLQLEDCYRICSGDFFTCHASSESCGDAGVIVADTNGAVNIDCITCPGSEGRLPNGLRSQTMPSADAVADYFARMAHLEAASVVSFQRLFDELTYHEAPHGLLEAVQSAAQDEVRHAELAAQLSARFGGTTVPPWVDSIPMRTLEEVIAENAVEGCVRETLGALIATFQGEHAGNFAIAETMRLIGDDERRHAALSWAIDAWARPRLDRDAHHRILKCRRDAIQVMRRAANANVPETLRQAAGLPSALQFRALIDEVEERLWATS